MRFLVIVGWSTEIRSDDNVYVVEGANVEAALSNLRELEAETFDERPMRLELYTYDDLPDLPSHLANARQEAEDVLDRYGFTSEDVDRAEVTGPNGSVRVLLN